MLVKILSAAIGPGLSFRAGQTADIPDELAEKWIASGVATDVVAVPESPPEGDSAGNQSPDGSAGGGESSQSDKPAKPAKPAKKK